MMRADVPPNIKEKLGTCEGRKEMWRLFASKGEDMEEMSAHLMTVSLRQSQEQTRRHSWTTRAALESQLGVQDTDHVFSLARQQGRWLAHQGFDSWSRCTSWRMSLEWQCVQMPRR